MIRRVTDASFDAEVLRAASPIIVVFWSEWCNPAWNMGAFLAKINRADLMIKTVNVDENKGLRGRYGIVGIPATMLFMHGRVVGTKYGVLSKSKFTDWVLKLADAS